MHSDVTICKGCRRVLQVTAEWPEVEKEYKSILDEVRTLDIPGFRPGKAPLAVIEKKYKTQIREAFDQRVVRRILLDISEEKDLGPVGLTEASNITFQKGETYTFTASFAVAPTIELPDYKSFAATEGASDSEARDELSEFLLENASFDLPVALIEEELRADEEKPDTATAASPEQILAAEQRVRLILILRQIADKDGIEVDQQDIDERIAAMADAYGVREYALRTELAQNSGIPRLKLFLLAEQTMDYILE